MDIALLHKFTQHKDLRRELLSTGNAELIEVRATCKVGHRRGLTDLCRTQTKTHSGVVGQMGKGRTNLGRLLNVSVTNCVKKSDGSGRLLQFLDAIIAYMPECSARYCPDHPLLLCPVRQAQFGSAILHCQ